MNTNISAKEKKILIFLGVFVLIFLYFYIFLIPRIRVINKLKEEISTYNNEYEVNKEYMNRIKNIDSELKILYQKQKNLWKTLPPYINYDEVLLIIKDSSEKSNLEISDIQFDAPIPIKSEEEIVEENQINENAEEDGSNVEKEEANGVLDDNKLKSAMEFFGISDLTDIGVEESINEGDGFYVPLRINLTGSYSNLKEFIKIVKEKQNKMEFANVNIDNTMEDILNFNLKLYIYGIKDSSVDEYSLITDEEKLEINNNDSSNIFSLIEGVDKESVDNYEEGLNSEDEQIESSDISKIGNYDFSIRLLPFGNNMAPPTITITGKNILSDNIEDSLIPTIYGDGNKNVQVDFEFIKKSDKYYVKYRTEQDSFPELTYTNMAEFVPIKDNIILLIDSTNRKYKNDEAGIILNISNSSDMDVNVKIINDDKENPRFNSGNNSGNVNFEFETVNE
jgi:type IV pilus assembly protein PilO